MAELNSTVTLDIVSHVFMYSTDGWKVVVDDLDSVEPIAEQLDAVRLRLV